MNAVYGGSTQFLFFQSVFIPTMIAMASTTTTVTSSVPSPVFGQSTTLTATVGAVAPVTGTATGTVTFKDVSATLGTGTLSVLNGQVVATLSTATLSKASHSITEVYAGDTNFTTSSFLNGIKSHFVGGNAWLKAFEPLEERDFKDSFWDGNIGDRTIQRCLKSIKTAKQS